jgi:hypothetical protein
VCGGSEEGLGLSALWSLLTCTSGRDEGSHAAALGGADDGINYSRISQRYDVVYHNRFHYQNASSGLEDLPAQQTECLTKVAASWGVLPTKDNMLDDFLAKIEVKPAAASESLYTYDPAAEALSLADRTDMRTCLLKWRERAPTMRELFNLYVVMDRMWKPVIEEKATSLDGWSTEAPPRWNGTDLSIDALLEDLWSGQVFLYGELTPNHENLMPILRDLIDVFHAATDKTSRADGSESGAGASSSKTIEVIRWTERFHPVYRTIVWLMREQVRPWGEREGASWFNPEEASKAKFALADAYPDTEEPIVDGDE